MTAKSIARSWPVQEAKARFSEFLEASLTEGPQLVTRRGVEAAVLVPVASGAGCRTRRDRRSRSCCSQSRHGPRSPSRRGIGGAGERRSRSTEPVYLLDTNVVSELRRPRPHGAVVAWLEGVADDSLHLSAATLGELQAGVALGRQLNADQINEVWASPSLDLRSPPQRPAVHLAEMRTR